MTELLVPLLLLFVSLYGLLRGQDVYACLLQGAREGLSTLLSIVPSLNCHLHAPRERLF